MIKINSNHAPEAIGPYSQAILSGSILYSSGQIGLNPQTMKIVEGGIENETKQVCENLGAVLKEAGLNYNNVVKTTILLDDINDFNTVNTIYESYFSHKPARSTFEVAKLPAGAKIEIELIACN